MQCRKPKVRFERGLDPRLAALESAVEDARPRLPNEPGRPLLADIREARREPIFVMGH